MTMLVMAACNEIDLFTNLEEKEANLMLAVLLREGIAAERIKNPDATYNIQIKDKAYFAEAMTALTIRGYPKQKFENLCTTFKGEGMVSTPLEQKARYNCAKSQELTSHLMKIDGIIYAGVSLELSETDPISRKIKPAKASIVLKYKAGMDIDNLIPKVKQLVAFSVAHMHYDDVMVTPMSETGGTQNDVYVKPTDAELASTTPNLIGDKDPFQRENSNFLIYVFLAILCAIMVGFMVFILRMRKTKLLSEEDETPASGEANVPAVTRIESDF